MAPDQTKASRITRARRFMAEQQLDILVVGSTDSIASQGNVRFLTGYATAFGLSLALLAPDGDPVLLVPSGSFQKNWAETTAWTTTIKAVPHLATAALETIKEMAADNVTVGLAGFEDLPGALNLQDADAPPAMRFVSVSAPFRLMRAVKTADEIDQVRRSVVLADAALSALSATLRVDSSENALFARAAAALFSEGAEHFFLLGSTGTRAPAPVPAARRLQSGDVVRFSVEPAGPGGFWTQTIRVFSLGRPSGEVQRAFDLCAAALARAEGRLRPGATGGEVARTITRILEQAGGARPGPLGHGMGLDLTEPPFIHAEDETRLEPGMVIALHPYLSLGESVIWMGDTYLVTEDQPQRLSGLSNELVVV